ncbi:MAG: CoA transferase [Gammaproteobacteria bacterium]|nr:CoA transferase [Gammaproteobacteria bacterium]MDH3466387.1 CoA transferase [Gammaproteobacteria bacterium]
MVQGPLSGVTVVDMTRVLAGPYCTMMLYDLGARVIKVETPQKGDDSRHIGPFINGKSAYFMSLNRGKQSVALDLKAEQDRELFEALLERADVLVENYRPGVMERLGYGWDALHAQYSRLIYAAASGFGHTGPYAERPAYDMVVQAMGGLMSITGQPDGKPTRVGSSIGDITAGLFTVAGVNAALYRRVHSGVGMKIDVAMLDCQVAILENAIARYCASGEVPGPIGARHPSITPFEAFATKDGHVIVAAGNDGLFKTLCDATGNTNLEQDDRFRTNDLRTQYHVELKAILDPSFAAKSTQQWLDILASAGIPCGPINNIAEVLDDPQVRARNMVVSVEDAVAGRVRMAGNPIKMSEFDDPDGRAAAPDLDADRAAIIAEFFDPTPLA